MELLIQAPLIAAAGYSLVYLLAGGGFFRLRDLCCRQDARTVDARAQDGRRRKQPNVKERRIHEHRLAAIDAEFDRLDDRERSEDEAARERRRLLSERTSLAAQLAENPRIRRRRENKYGCPAESHSAIGTLRADALETLRMGVASMVLVRFVSDSGIA